MGWFSQGILRRERCVRAEAALPWPGSPPTLDAIADNANSTLFGEQCL